MEWKKLNTGNCEVTYEQDLVLNKGHTKRPNAVISKLTATSVEYCFNNIEDINKVNSTRIRAVRSELYGNWSYQVVSKFREPGISYSTHSSGCLMFLNVPSLFVLA